MRSHLLQAVFALLSAISLTSFGQTLNDILEGVAEVNPATAMATPVIQSMVPQNGTPERVWVWKCNGVDHNRSDCFGGEMPSMTPEESLPELYAYYPKGRDTLEFIIFEEGAYLIECMDSEGNNMGEGVIIMMNENFVANGINTGCYEQLGGLTNSIKPLRIGRDQPAFVCFN